MTVDKNALIIVGLGNPGEEYAGTRHNAGRDAVMLFAKEADLPAFEENKKLRALVTEGKANKHLTFVALPQTFMNKSGETLKSMGVFSQKRISENLIIVQDDLDLPLGTIKIVKNRGSAGHKGVESAMRALKTPDFTRIRIGIAKASTIRKSQSDSVVIKTVIGKISPEEKTLLKKGIKKAASALSIIAEHGVERAMNECN